VGYVAANQVALLVVLHLANSGHSGTVTAYQNAFIYFQLPHGLVAVTLMTTFLPELAHAWVGRDLAALRARFLQALRLLWMLIIPASVGYVILGRDITHVLLSHGRYTVADANQTGNTLIAFAVGLTGYSTYLITLNVFYAMKDTKTPFLVNLVENGVNIVMALILFHSGSVGLAAAYATAYVVAAGAALWMLDRRIGGLRGPELARFGQQTLRILAASAVMAVVVLLITLLAPAGTGGALVDLLIAAPIGIVAYGLAGLALGVDGIADAWVAIQRRLPMLHR
jgi:putative peptidoglycan lipid II flippase